MEHVYIYSTPWCAYCKMAKEFFKKNDVTYTEYDVSTDMVKRQEMLDKTHQMGVPVIVIGNKIVVGFERARISEFLGIK
jgi:glutaredoxin 3